MTKKTKTPGVKRFTIDRSKWLNGELYKRAQKMGLKGDGRRPSGTLRDREGRMCCLGFYASACGVKNITSIPLTTMLGPEQKKKIDPELRVHGSTAAKLAALNDSRQKGLTAKKREERLVRAFAKLGVKVTFKGEYPAVADIKPQKL